MWRCVNEQAKVSRFWRCRVDGQPKNKSIMPNTKSFLLSIVKCCAGTRILKAFLNYKRKPTYRSILTLFDSVLCPIAQTWQFRSHRCQSQAPTVWTQLFWGSKQVVNYGNYPALLVSTIIVILLFGHCICWSFKQNKGPITIRIERCCCWFT